MSQSNCESPAAPKSKASRKPAGPRRSKASHKSGSPRDITPEQIRRLARQKFGYDTLRAGQEEAILQVLRGHDVLSVMPTGSGKSAIYQIAALLIDGPTVVVSPLIALQKDQVQSIAEQELAPAAVLNSTQRVAQRREAIEQLADGSLEFLFLSPEQLANEETFARLMENKPSLFVVDEAHCVSEWGHDFRPDYCRLGAIIEALGHPRVLALTATASAHVREDIVERLNMRGVRTAVWGFDRPNIWLGVEQCPDQETKDRLVRSRVKDAQKPAIVYVATRKAAEEVCKWLTQDGANAGFYHGGMKKDERAAAQDAFMSDKTEVIVATNAFGMGVDKPDVRTVIHYDIPEAADDYYQEIGRAGRDGQASRALLLYRPEDVGRRMAQAKSGKISEEDLEEIADAIQTRGGAADAGELAASMDLPSGRVTQAINRLEEVGAVKVLADGEVLPASRKLDTTAAAHNAAVEQDAYRQYRVGRVELMKGYAQTTDCRRRYLLKYFGEEPGDACGNCDNCETGVVEQHEALDTRLPFPLKSRVTHKKWGDGVVMGYEADKIIVLFDTQGTKSLVTDFVIEHALLAPG